MNIHLVTIQLNSVSSVQQRFIKLYILQETTHPHSNPNGRRSMVCRIRRRAISR